MPIVKKKKAKPLVKSKTKPLVKSKYNKKMCICGCTNRKCVNCNCIQRTGFGESQLAPLTREEWGRIPTYQSGYGSRGTIIGTYHNFHIPNNKTGQSSRSGNMLVYPFV